MRFSKEYISRNLAEDSAILKIMSHKMQKGGIHVVKPDAYAGIYREIAEQIDNETAMRIFQMLRGQMVVFPQKLYNQEYVRSFIRENSGKYTVRELSVRFGYSDRRIRQFMSEEKQRGS